MPVWVLMKAFERTPARYDRAMHGLTCGRITQMKKAISSIVAGRSCHVLELGCGTGSLAVSMAEAGARVLGVDASERMLETARERAAVHDVADRIDLRRLTAMEIDSLPERSFDFVVGTLLLSELSPEEARFVLEASRRLLAPGGRLVIGDETVPGQPCRRLVCALVRRPLALAAYLIAQARSLPDGAARRVLYFVIELPLMLLSFLVQPGTSLPLRNFNELLRTSGFRVVARQEYLGGTLTLIQARTA